ncbi:hypothetical protein SAMN05421747_1269 [Parapedobacter composti]|uniref:Uncharacterized protein n=1 Tax=Parapedobacter composti TaxID=623281 RepID=A0A1I1M797_9SPHI|nr:hypothetical protein [Parapedobacter composti]SFC78453.1 hypothetical protein SAMN05421747_1269 [Parapedobacter composti]
MQAISSRKHGALTAALQRLAELAAEHDRSGAAEGDIREGLSALSDTYGRYEALLAELAETIAVYEKLHHDLRVNVLGPGLRKLRRRTKPSNRD